MTTSRRGGIRMVVLGAIGLTVAGCNGSATELEEPMSLLSVSPPGGAVGVSVTAPVQILFDHAMAAGMATGSMMTGPGGQGGSTHMGDGWRHPADRSYGMVFVFTIAG